MALKISRWDEVFETHKTRAVKVMTWCALPIDFSSTGYCEIMSKSDGIGVYGAWCALICVASRCEPRGTLIRRDGAPHDADSLSVITRIHKKKLTAAISRLISIGWLIEDTDLARERPPSGARAPRSGARAPRSGASAPVPTDIQTGKTLPDREKEPAAQVPRKPPKTRPRNEIWDAIAAIFFPDGVPESSRTRVGKHVADLTKLGATHDEIRARYDRYRAEWPNVECTPKSLIEHWSRFGPVSPLRPSPGKQPEVRPGSAVPAAGKYDNLPHVRRASDG